METIRIVSQILAAVSGSLVALMSILIFIRLHWPAPGLWTSKLFVSALSPLLTLIGVLSTFVGMTTGSVLISLIGLYDVLVFFMHIFRVTRPSASSGSFERAFGLN